MVDAATNNVHRSVGLARLGANHTEELNRYSVTSIN